ncbi:hypothetical protein C7455_1022 [Roseicyclus mahoneyensis]|jgi:hypothetical protein|uniref:Uncharacterized protein n=1 Tax=Roseicyclus mahoneyensis TaxID=164332 RepID=A0A316GKY6_9RHOB|nr:hypothetical protein C7455_1022 [Roseicyclus mahoneyensis]
MAAWGGIKVWMAAFSRDSRKVEIGRNAAYESAGSIDPLNRGLEGASKHILGAQIVRRRILIVADPSCQLLDHVSWLDRFTLGVEMCSSLSDAKARAAHFAEPLIVLVGIDYFQDLDVAVDALGRFRATTSNLPVVIASTSFARPDLSCERAMIADASIRLPASRPQIALALGAAVTNHRVVRKRLGTSLLGSDDVAGPEITGSVADMARPSHMSH